MGSDNYQSRSRLPFMRVNSWVKSTHSLRCVSLVFTTRILKAHFEGTFIIYEEPENVAIVSSFLMPKTEYVFNIKVIN